MAAQLHQVGSGRGRSASAAGAGAEKLKVILLGDSGVGKTSIITQYVLKKFEKSKPPVDFQEALEKRVELANNKHAILQILDTGGQNPEAARFNNVKGCMLVYDVTNAASFDNLENWRNEFICRVIAKPGDPRMFPFIVVGNKVDLHLNTTHRWNSQNARQWCQKHGILHHRLTSAKDNNNIDDAFQLLAQLAFEQEAKIRVTTPPPTIATDVEQQACPVQSIDKGNGSGREDPHKSNFDPKLSNENFAYNDQQKNKENSLGSPTISISSRHKKSPIETSPTTLSSDQQSHCCCSM